MRYIGNKTRLLPFILRTLARAQIPIGSVHDAFAGTASVGRALKAQGWRVHTSDILMSSYVFQRAHVVADSADPMIREMAEELAKLPPVQSFISRHFSPAGGATSEGRMYFTVDNAGRI
ncbi:MAG: DNA adenine methylase, partial [Gemmatimonadaceae bacterium]